MLTIFMAASPLVDLTAVGDATDSGVPAEAPDVRPAPSRTRMIVVLGLLVALGPLTIDMYLPALPRIASELGLSSSVAQLTLTGTLGGLALGQLIVGPLSDALGRRRPLVAGILLHMAASLLCLFAPNIEVLGIARALQGVGAAAASVVAVAVVSDLFEESVAAVVMSPTMPFSFSIMCSRERWIPVTDDLRLVSRLRLPSAISSVSSTCCSVVK